VEEGGAKEIGRAKKIGRCLDRVGGCGGRFPILGRLWYFWNPNAGVDKQQSGAEQTAADLLMDTSRIRMGARRQTITHIHKPQILAAWFYIYYF
jgi:hypothetical protein